MGGIGEFGTLSFVVYKKTRRNLGLLQSGPCKCEWYIGKDRIFIIFGTSYMVGAVYILSQELFN